MKKTIILSIFSTLLFTACSSDEYTKLRKMTVQDYINNPSLLSETSEKCTNREIKDAEICSTVEAARIKKRSESFPDW